MYIIFTYMRVRSVCRAVSHFLKYIGPHSVFLRYAPFAIESYSFLRTALKFFSPSASLNS